MINNCNPSPLLRQLGAAAIELTILIPFIVFFLIGSADLARITHTLSMRESGLRVGLMTGASLLNKKRDYELRNVDKEVVVPESIKNQMISTAVNEAPSNINFQITSIKCRCPSYDLSEPGNTGNLACNASIIKDCSMLPEIFIEMTASMQIELFFEKFFGLKDLFYFRDKAITLSVR